MQLLSNEGLNMLRTRALGPQHSAQGHTCQPQLEVLVLVEQQLEVLHEQQDEQLQDELLARSSDGSVISSTSKVTASRSSSSRPSV
jgi:hypothetical protein